MNLDPEHYWHLVTWKDEIIKVRPENVKLIQDKLNTAEGYITTPTRSISVKDIKDFIESDEIYTDQKLIEEGSKAFGIPVIDENGSIVVRHVKKSVPRREYIRFYSHNAAYRKLEENDNHVVIVWRQPVHMINSNTMSELSPDDERNISVRVAS